MENKHWNDDDLLAKLCGIGPQDAHLDACEECCARWERLQGRHEHMRLGDNMVSQELLIRQRQAIYQRIGPKPRRFVLRLATSMAALLLLLAFLIMFKPVSKRETADISDAEFFEDVFATASSTEPSTFEPVQSLFEAQR